jgi:multiple sugar transport system substrate-binding protein
MFKRMGLWLIVVLVLAFVVVGCSKTEPVPAESVAKQDAAQEKQHDPLTLKFYQFDLVLTDADFQKLFADPVKKKFPYITLELVRAGKGTNPEDLVAAGDFPDILFSTNPTIQQLDKLGVLADLAPMVKQFNTDINRFEPDAMDAMKQYGKNGELLALPFSRNFSPLFYNKDIFDKFGVNYPKDGMTFDEVYELAKKVTRSDGGVNYRGFDYGQAYKNIGSSLSLNMVNPASGKADITTDGWKKTFSMMQKMYSIPGNMPENSLGSLGKLRKEFTTGNVAMMVDRGTGLVPMLQDLEQSQKPLHWDLASSPNFPEALGTEAGLDIHLFEMYSKGKHQEDAFKVIDYVTSKDVGLLASQGGRVSALTDKDIQKAYGTELPALKGKHVEAIFKVKPAKLQYPSEYNSIVDAKLLAAFKSFMLDSQDLNTALRTAQEAADKEIAEKKAQ